MNAIATALQKPFPASSVGWKPQTVKGERCLAVAYIDARDVMDRLDEVAGPDGWQDAYEFLPDGSVVCRLRVRFAAGEWVEKADVGGESDQPDGGDRRKAAVSDALKRAAVKFGIGRYLYRLDQQWVDFDAKTRSIPKPPRLPEWALPEEERRQASQPAKPAASQPAPTPVPAPAPAPARQPAPTQQQQQPRQPEQQTQAEPCALERRLREKEAELVKAALCRAGELVEHVLAAAEEARFPLHMREWNMAHAAVVAGWVREFESGAMAQFQARVEASQNRKITLEEVGKLSTLLASKGLTVAEALSFVKLPRVHAEELTKGQASKLVAYLKTLPDLEPVELG